MIDVNFSSAINNRTGKYFIGRDLISDQRSLIENIYYWRFPAENPPNKIVRRILNKMMTFEHNLRMSNRLDWCPNIFGRRPVLHIDPYSVCHSSLSKDDIVLCHDLGPITHPELFHPAVTDLYKWVYNYIARVGPRMVFVSKASEAQYEKLYGRTPSMTIIYPNLRNEVASELGEKVAVVDKPFFLTVGNVGNRKNQARSIEAFESSKLSRQGYTYVVCGGREPGFDRVEELAKATEGVVLLPYVGDLELIWLYKNAEFFVLPSLLEGFGVPVAEAILHGLVPLVSQESVLEEVAGPGAVSVDPLSVDGIRNGLLQLVEMSSQDKAERAALLKQSLTRFSREKFKSEWKALIAG